MALDGLRSQNGNPASPPYGNNDALVMSNALRHNGLVDLSANFDRYELVAQYDRLPQLNATIDQVYTVEAARAASQDFEILGTNASDDDVTFSATVAGVQLQTDGADNDQVIVLPHLDTSATAWTGIKWGTENQTEWECIIRTDASVAALTIWAGLKLTNTSVVATDDDQVFFRFDAAVANWEATTSIGGTDTETDSGVAVAANTVYKLRITINSSRIAKFYINNVLVHTTAALTNDVDLIPYVGVHANTGAAKTIHLVKQRISRIAFE